MDEEMIIATERLYLTADASRLVAEGDPKAATLYCSPGDIIPQSAADRFKLIDGALRKRTEKSVPASTPTAAPKTASKAKGDKPGKTKEAPSPPNKEKLAGDDKADGDQSQGDGTKGDGTQGDNGQGDNGQGDNGEGNSQTDGGQG